MTTGERIQQARKQAKLTQKELGEKLGVSASMIAQYENDLRMPKIETLQKIAAALNVDWQTLRDHPVFYFEDIIKVPATKTNWDNPDAVYTETREGKLFNAFMELNDSGKDEAIRYTVMLSEIDRYKKQSQEE